MTFNFDLTVTIGVIVTIALAVIGWFRMRHAAIDKSIKDCGARLDRHDVRIMAAEQTLKGMPGKDEMHALGLAISDLKGSIQTMGASVEGQRQILMRVENTVSRQEDHLMRARDR